MIKIQITLKPETLKELKMFMAAGEFKNYQQAIEYLLWFKNEKMSK